ncbi:MAG TPA: PKD domain-containing protein [Thermoleophilaceae bacterium]
MLAQVVFAAPPAANFSISDSTPNTGQSVTFTSTSSDPDDDIATFEWDFDYDGSFDADATGSSTSHTYNSPGARSVALRVTDTAGDPNAGGDGTVDSALSVKTVTVSTPNQNPVATDIAFAPRAPQNGTRPYVGQTVDFGGSGNDPDGDPITYEWSFGDGGTATGQAAAHAYGSAGSKTVTLTVRDNHGGTGTRQETVIVNALPVADAHVLNGAAETGQRMDVPLVGQAYALTSLAVGPGTGSSDAEGALSAFAWDFNYDGTFTVDATGSSVVAPASLQTAGQKTVALRVTDSNGATAIDSLSYRVNRAPVPGFIFDPPTPVVNKPVQFSSTSSDPDAGDTLTYSWDLDGDGTFGEAGEQGPNPAFTFTTDGAKTARLRVTDTGGITRELARPLTVQLSIPTAGFTSSPAAPAPGQAVRFTSTSAASEPGKQITAIEWDFNYDRSTDTFTPDASGASVTHAFPSSGRKTVAIRVTEGPAGGSGVVVGTVTVNALPSAGFSVSPTRPFARDVVTFSSSAQDPDGPLAKQEWDLDNDGRFDDAAGPVVLGKFAKPGMYTLALRVTDSVGARAVSSRQIRVRARPLALLDVDVAINGLLHGMRTEITSLVVLAPRGATVRVTCVAAGTARTRAAGCSKALKRVVRKRRRLRFRGAERVLTAGTKLVIRVTKPGHLGVQVTYTMRAGNRPRRVDRCFTPGAKQTTRCPAP